MKQIPLSNGYTLILPDLPITAEMLQEAKDAAAEALREQEMFKRQFFENICVRKEDLKKKWRNHIVRPQKTIPQLMSHLGL